MTGPVPALPLPQGIRPLSDKEFSLLRDLIYREAGIHLSPVKKALLVGRLSRRVRELGLASFGAYYDYVVGGEDPLEGTRMLERICTHETHFFREPRQFEFLEERAFPEWEKDAAAGRRSRQIRVLSAGCSTGQEPYSLAMLLLSRLPPEMGWSIEILATDLSRRALEQAESGIYRIEKAEEIPADLRKRFMLRGVRSQEGQMKAGPEIRSVVRFQRLNLNDARWPVSGRFDLILCRNVLIYFDEASRRAVIHRLVDLLAPDGYLLLGHAETLNRICDRLGAVGPTIYGRPRKAPPKRRQPQDAWPPRLMGLLAAARTG